MFRFRYPKVIILAFFCLIGIRSISAPNAIQFRNPIIDSLQVVLNIAKDSSKVDVLNQIANNYYFYKPSQAIPYANQALKLAQKLKYVKGSSEAERIIGIALGLQNRQKESIEWLFKGLNDAEKIHFAPGISACLTSVGAMYVSIKSWSQALTYFQRAFSYQQKKQNTVLKGIIYANLGKCYMAQDKLDTAYLYLKASQSIFAKKPGNAWSALPMAQLAELYLKQGEYTRGLALSQVAVRSAFSSGQTIFLRKALLVESQIYLKTGEPDKAEVLARQAIEYTQEIGYLPFLVENYDILFNVLYARGDYRNSAQVLQTYHQYKDSLDVLGGRELLAQQELLHELHAQESDYDALKKENNLQEARNKSNEAIIRRQQLIGLAIVFWLIIAALSAFVFFRLRQKERKSNRQLFHKNKELQEQKTELAATLKLVEGLNAKLRAQNNSLNQVAIMSITDLDGKIQTVNDKFTHISGFRKKEIIGKKHNVLKSNVHDKAFFQTLWKTIASGKTWRGEICNRNKFGQIYWTDTAIAPILDDKGKPKQYIAIQFEITPRKRNMIQLEKQKAELTEMNVLKDKLFSLISHDFRSPLRSLIGTLSLFLSGTVSGDDMQRLCAALLEKMEDTSNMLDNLLIWAKTQLKGMSVSPIMLDLHGVTDGILKLLEPQADKKNLNLKNRVLPGIFAFADLEMVKLVLRNLVSNAIKFSRNDSTVEVYARKVNDIITISVKDQGVGITDSQKEKLFSLEDFSTLGTANERGMGMGLMLCKDFIEKNHGKIWVESQQNQGSTFSFSLPSKENMTVYN